MKLDTTSIANLNKLLAVSALASIDNLIIEDGTARGVDEDKSVVLISDQNIPSFGKDVKAGLTRLSMLSQRLNLVKGKDDIEVEVKLSPTNEISQLEITGSGAKVQYRGANLNTIKAPRAVNTNATWQIDIPLEMLAVIQNGANAMGAKKAILNRKTGNEVFIEFIDDNNDAFSMKIADTATFIGEGDAPNPVFIHYYPSKTLLSILKAAGSECDKVVTVVIGNIGTLQVLVSGHLLTIIPKMND